MEKEQRVVTSPIPDIEREEEPHMAPVMCDKEGGELEGRTAKEEGGPVGSMEVEGRGWMEVLQAEAGEAGSPGRKHRAYSSRAGRGEKEVAGAGMEDGVRVAQHKDRISSPSPDPTWVVSFSEALLDSAEVHIAPVADMCA